MSEKAQLNEAAGKPQKEWTVAIDLAVLFESEGPNGHMGAEDKAKMLQKLEKQTEHSPVTIVVEVLSLPQSGNPGGPLSTSSEAYQVTQLVLHDGKMDVGPTTPSKGIRADFSDLMNSAAAQPSAKLAVVLNAHGMGDAGLAGGIESQGSPPRVNGRMTPTEIATTVEKARQKFGRNAVDVFDFDSCLMAESGALSALSKATDQVVASELTEHAISGPERNAADTQNLNAWLTSLLSQPTMDGAELARAIVESANHGSNKGIGPDGMVVDATPTLSQFDLRHYGEFKGLLDDLGASLTNVMADSKYKQMIEHGIDVVPDLVISDRESPFLTNGRTAKRDLQAFMNVLKLLLVTGNLPDPDKHVAKAISNMELFLKDPNKLIADAHIVDRGAGSAVLSGVSVFLPSSSLREDHAVTDVELDSIYKAATGNEEGGWLRAPCPPFRQRVRPV
jgi:hypothetical protein